MINLECRPLEKCFFDFGDCCKPIIDDSKCTDCKCNWLNMKEHGFEEKTMPRNLDEFLEYTDDPETSIYDQSAAYFSVGFQDVEMPLYVFHSISVCKM